jgi:hypothetical protein
MVKVYPRQIDLDNVQKLAQFEVTELVVSIAELQAAIDRKMQNH